MRESPTLALLVVVTIVWAALLHIVDVMTLVCGPDRGLCFVTDPKISSPAAVGVHTGIAFCLMILAVIELSHAVIRSRHRLNAVVAFMVLILAAGFGARVQWESRRFAQVAVRIPGPYLHAQHIGVVEGADVERMKVRLLTCEEVTLRRPRGPLPRVVAVNELRQPRSPSRSFELLEPVEVHDLCAYLLRVRGDRYSPCSDDPCPR